MQRKFCTLFQLDEQCQVCDRLNKKAVSEVTPQCYLLHSFGFVFFSTEEEVTAAVEEKQGSELGGQALFLDFSGAKSQLKDQPHRSSGGGGGSTSFGGVLALIFLFSFYSLPYFSVL